MLQRLHQFYLQQCGVCAHASATRAAEERKLAGFLFGSDLAFYSLRLLLRVLVVHAESLDGDQVPRVAVESHVNLPEGARPDELSVEPGIGSTLVTGGSSAGDRVCPWDNVSG